ncbi:MAG TPA: hypothetical protein VJR90_04200 [Gammaproteobacteria bacterium]|nr:hypothetical protein [Gammaproteobacteria bacterium]
MIKIFLIVVLFMISLHSFGAGNKIDTDLFYIPNDAPKGTMSLLKHAARLALKSQQCVEVIGGAWSTRKEAAEETPFDPDKQFFIQCQSNQPGPVPGSPAVFNLYYSYKDLRSNTIEQRPVPIPDNVAIAECKKAILGRLKFPSSAEMALVRYGANGTDNNLVIYNFTALNGFGNRIPQKGSCIITPKNEIDVRITNR